MHGGIKVYRGSAAAARSYVEADRSQVDDYYLAEGTGLADRYVVTPDRVVGVGSMDGDGYERWVAGYDAAGVAKGRLRTDDKGVRFVEVTVNGPKTWSLVAAVHPEVAAAYDAAQDRAAAEIIGWVAAHATTRVGPRGRQLQVPVEEIEAAVIRHHTSRAGDPHRHLHLQINARVQARVGDTVAWRGLHTVGVRDSLAAINGIGHAAIACDPRFRQVLADHGYHLDRDTAEIVELAPYAGRFSARAAQIGRNTARYETTWRAEHPGQEPGRRLRQAWDTRAWAQARPDKVLPVDGTILRDRWVSELHDLGFRPPIRPAIRPVPVGGLRPGRVDRNLVVEVVLSRLGAARSAWNTADIRGQVEQLLVVAGVVADPAARVELAEDLVARTLAGCVPLLARGEVPAHVRALTSPGVLAVEADLITRLAARVPPPGMPGVPPCVPPRVAWGVPLLVRGMNAGLDDGQARVAAVLAGEARLLVVEGAAGAGKTSVLAAVQAALEADGRRLVVVTPTRKAANVATTQLGAPASSAARLAYQYGFRWDDDGRWDRIRADQRPARPLDMAARLLPGDLLLVDEAGMLDQDTARALLVIADETGARIALVGDRHQLPAVGRGGVIDLGTRWAPPQARLTLDTVHRFTDPYYAALTLAMRTGEHPEAVFDQLHAQGHLVIHPTEAHRQDTLTAAADNRTDAGEEVAVMADSNEQVAALNAAIRDHRLTSDVGGDPSGLKSVATAAGEEIGVGDRVTTRRNDTDLDVANRDTWTVTRLGADGSLTIAPAHQDRHHRALAAVGERTGERWLPAAYVARYVELGYATTVYGAQGETVDHAHLLVGDSTGAASAYVGMTRGRHTNTAHLVAETLQDARAQWVTVFSRDRADLGPGHAATQAAADIDRYGPASRPEPRSPVRDSAAAMQAAVLAGPSAGRLEEQRHVPAGPATPRPGIGR